MVNISLVLMLIRMKAFNNNKQMNLPNKAILIQSSEIMGKVNINLVPINKPTFLSSRQIKCLSYNLLPHLVSLKASQ